MQNEDPLAVLVGEQINAIAFVLDYVELHFNGPILRCIANPIVSCELGEFVFPCSGSRDALCSLIGDRPSRIAITEKEAIVLEMSGGCTLTVPLTEDHARGGESAHFVRGVNEPIQVW